jgi:uncharacterized membrane protein YdjX (TVP38/TMEM64 family)
LQLAVVALVIVVVNMLPAFAPPTWAILVLVQARYGYPTAVLVVVGACAAATGRTLLALGARRVRHWVSPQRLESLEAAKGLLVARRATAIGALALFLVSPLPSGQLFVAAGLLDLRLPPLVAAFLVGRLFSYTVYLTAASAAAATVDQLIGKGVSSWVAVAVQIALFGLVIVLARVDWVRVAKRLAPKGETEPRSADVEDDALGER